MLGPASRGNTLRLYGCNIADQQARMLMASLIGSGDSDGLLVAEMISGALSRQEPIGKLTPEMRDAILDVLGSGTHNGLLGLRTALANDRRARS